MLQKYLAPVHQHSERQRRYRAGSQSTWFEPSSTGTHTITAYDIQYRQGTSGAWTLVEDVWETGDGDLEYTISSLMADVEYQVQVRAVSAAGDGAWSATGTGTPQARNCSRRSHRAHAHGRIRQLHCGVDCAGCTMATIRSSPTTFAIASGQVDGRRLRTYGRRETGRLMRP